MVKGGGVDGRCNGGRVVVVFGEMLVFWWLWGWCLLLVVVVWVVYFSYLFEMVWYLLVECVRCSYWLMYCWNMMLLCGIMYVFLLNWNGLFGCIEYRFGFSFCCSSVLDVFVIIMLVLFVRICLKIVMLFGQMVRFVCVKNCFVNCLLVLFGLMIIWVLGWLICVMVWYLLVFVQCMIGVLLLIMYGCVKNMCFWCLSVVDMLFIVMLYFVMKLLVRFDQFVFMQLVFMLSDFVSDLVMLMLMFLKWLFV